MNNVTIYYNKKREEYIFVFNETRKRLYNACAYDCLISFFSIKQQMIYSEHSICNKGRHLGVKIDISEAPDEIIQFWNEYKKGEDKL